MTAFTLRDVEAADSLGLARLDDDGAPAAVTSTFPHGSTKTAGKPSGAGGGAPPAIPAGPPSCESALTRHSVGVARSTEDGGDAPATHMRSCLA